MNFLYKIAYFFKKPILITIIAESDSGIIDLIFNLLKDSDFRFKKRDSFSFTKDRIFLIKSQDDDYLSNLPFLINNSSLPVLILKGENIDLELAFKFVKSFVITDEGATKFLRRNDFSNSLLSTGFDDRFDLWVSDLNVDKETNFKINHGGDTIPFWINKELDRDEIIDLMLVIRTGVTIGLNLVWISQRLNSIYKKKNLC